MITLNKYIEQLQKIAKQHPSFGNLPVIYAEDDEGNGYQTVNNPPTIFSVVNIEDRHLEPDMEMLQKAGQGIDTESEDFKNLNCIIIN